MREDFRIMRKEGAEERETEKGLLPRRKVFFLSGQKLGLVEPSQAVEEERNPLPYAKTACIILFLAGNAGKNPAL